MEDFAAMIGAVVNLMKFEFTLWGFSLSFWQILIWGMVATIILGLIWGFFSGK